MIPDAYDEVVAPEPLMPDPEPEDALALVEFAFLKNMQPSSSSNALLNFYSISHYRFFIKYSISLVLLTVHGVQS